MSIAASPSCDISFNSYVTNLTSSYAGQSNEATMVSSSIFILALAGVFFNINLLRRFSDLSAVRNRGVQRLLSAVLSIFLPVMSYLFSEAKNSDQVYAQLRRSVQKPDLPPRAGLILVWMLLVELLRNNMEEIRMQGYETSGIIQRAGRVVWLGSLVFSNVRSAGRKAVYGGLWILSASKLVQRVAFTETGKRSYVHHKNSRLIASYMSQRLQHADVDSVVEHAVQVPVEVEHAELTVDVDSIASYMPPRPKKGADATVHSDHRAVQVDGTKLLENCEYIVMGEEKLGKSEAMAPHDINPYDTRIVTVGKVSKLSDNIGVRDGPEGLKRLSLSFALFKILRRRFEYRGELSVEEASDCRKLLLTEEGSLFKINGGKEDKKNQVKAVFQVMDDEVQFLREYYHSVLPVVLTSPFFLLSNYLLLPVVLLGLWLMTVVLCGNGDVSYSFSSITADNYTLNFGIIKLTKCLLEQVTTSAEAFFSMVDVSITFFLIIIFMYEEVWEYCLVVLSNWFVVSLLCNYVSKPRWRKSSVRALGCIMWVRNKMPHTKLSFKQFSVLSLRRPLIFATPDMLLSLTVRSVTVPDQVKRSILEYLSKKHELHEKSKKRDGKKHEAAGATIISNDKSVLVPVEVKHDQEAANAGATLLISNGKSALKNKHMDLSWACENESVAEVILTWHIATSLILQLSPRDKEEDATKLSEYCAYLVVFHPELLPDNKDKTEHVFKTMKKELRSTLGFVDYYFSWQDARARKIMETVAQEKEEECRRWTENNVLKNGAKLAKVLQARTSQGGADHVWQVLADVWTEVMVYVATSSEEVQVKWHENFLVQGPEFVTSLWALTTHTGFSREPTHTGSTRTTNNLNPTTVPNS